MFKIQWWLSRVAGASRNENGAGGNGHSSGVANDHEVLRGMDAGDLANVGGLRGLFHFDRLRSALE